MNSEKTASTNIGIVKMFEDCATKTSIYDNI